MKKLLLILLCLVALSVQAQTDSTRSVASVTFKEVKPALFIAGMGTMIIGGMLQDDVVTGVGVAATTAGLLYSTFNYFVVKKNKRIQPASSGIGIAYKF